MANEGFLGRFEIGGELAATDDHPAVIHHLPLSKDALDSPIPVGTLMKRVAATDGEEISEIAYAPFLSTDSDATPIAVVNAPCDKNETSAFCVVHGCVKARLLKTGDGKTPTAAQLAKLFDAGIFAV